MNPVTPLHQLLAERSHVRGLALRLARNTADAEDLEQRAWLGALRHPPRHAAGLRTWFSTKVRYLAINEAQARRRRADREVFANEERRPPTPDELAIQREVVMRIDSVLDRLDERYSAVIRLRFFQGLSPHEIGQRLELPVETVRTRLRRGMMSMRSSLDGEFGDRQVWSTAIVGMLSIWPAGRRAAKAGVSAGGGLFTNKLLVLLAVSVFGAVGVASRWSGHDVDSSIRNHDARVALGNSDVSALLHPAGEERVQLVQASSASASGRLAVRASDAERGQPLAGLNIRVEAMEHDGSDSPDVEVLTTALDGRAHLGDLPPGTWEVIPERGDSQWVRVESGRLSELEFRVPAGERLVVLAETPDGTPVPGVSIQVSRPGRADGWRHVGTSDDDGQIELRGIDPRSWIAGEAQGCRPAHARRASHRDEDGRIHLILLPARSLSGQVVDALGRPIAGARLEFLSNVTSKVGYGTGGIGLPVWKRLRTVTDGEGRWGLIGVMTRPQDLRVTAVGYRSRVERVCSAVPGQGPLEFVLQELTGAEPGGDLFGTVVDEWGAAFPGAIVLARDTGSVRRSPMLAFAGLDEYRRAATDGAGGFRIAVDHHGPHDLYVLGPNGQATSPLVCLPGVEPGNPVLLACSAEPSGALTGQFSVRDHARALLILDSVSLAVPRVVDLDPTSGSFREDGLPAGEYQVYAIVHGESFLVGDSISLLASERRDVGALIAPALGSLRAIVRAEEGLDVSKVALELFGDLGRERRVRLVEGSGGSFAIDGTFRMTQVPVGTQRVIFKGPGVASAWASVEVFEGRESSFELTLTRGYLQPFEVRSLGGCIGSVIVEAVDCRGRVMAHRSVDTRAASGASGFWLAPGSYRMRLTQGDETTEGESFDVSEEKGSRLLLHLE